MNTLRSLDEALEWIQSVWVDDRPVPIRLHDLETDNQGELGAPRMTAGFLRWLLARPSDTFDVVVTVNCPDPSHTSGEWRMTLCPICAGRGTYDVTRRRYRYPLWRALAALERKPAIRPGHPSPAAIVSRLARVDWHPLIACELAGLNWDLYEALALMAIRDLRHRYQVAPVPRRSWLDRSENSEAIA